MINVVTSTFTGYDTAKLFAADMNGDGFPDLVATCEATSSSNTYQFAVFLADPTHPGQFLSPTIYVPPASVYNMLVQDLNHDGLPDVVVSGAANSFSVYLGDPAHPGSLLAPKNTAAPVRRTPSWLRRVISTEMAFPMSSPQTATCSRSSPVRAMAPLWRPPLS